MRPMWIIAVLALTLADLAQAQTNRMGLRPRPLPSRLTALTGITWVGTGSNRRPQYMAGSIINGKKVGGQYLTFANAWAFARSSGRLQLGRRELPPRSTPSLQVGRMNLRLGIQVQR